MREALEQVKRELGEEALVLDTKRVRAGGFLGLGAREQIEVRVAADTATKSGKKQEEKRATRHGHRASLLNLTDDAPAMPARAERTGIESDGPRKNPHGGASALSALLARAYSDDAPHANMTVEGEPVADVSQRGVEIADTEPRFVHRGRAVSVKPAGKPVAAATTLTTSVVTESSVAGRVSNVTPEAGQPRRNTINHELECLRAELREVKFSLGTLAARPAALSGLAHKAAESFEEMPELYDSPYFDAYIELAGQGLTPELARRAVCEAIRERRREAGGIQVLADGGETFLASKGLAVHEKRTSDEVALAGLQTLIASAVRFSADPLTATTGATKTPSVVALIGPTGVGKTTTIAKLAARVALREGRRVELITLDTYRIAAAEQLRIYAEIIGAGFHVARSMVELDALTRKLESEGVVLVDTVGRNPHDLADQLELGDYLRAREEIVKCLVLQATTHPSDALAAVRKFTMYGADRLIVTKLDETAAPGRTVTLASESKLPLLYLCAGQRVPEDLERATSATLAARVVRAGTTAA